MDRFERKARCPYCGEVIELLVDLSDLGSEYVEDCQVCCRPMVVILLGAYEGVPEVILCREDD